MPLVPEWLLTWMPFTSSPAADEALTGVRDLRFLRVAGQRVELHQPGAGDRCRQPAIFELFQDEPGIAAKFRLPERERAGSSRTHWCFSLAPVCPRVCIAKAALTRTTLVPVGEPRCGFITHRPWPACRPTAQAHRLRGTPRGHDQPSALLGAEVASKMPKEVRHERTSVRMNNPRQGPATRPPDCASFCPEFGPVPLRGTPHGEDRSNGMLSGCEAGTGRSQRRTSADEQPASYREINDGMARGVLPNSHCYGHASVRFGEGVR